jgi:hypothetical protein
VGRLGRICLLMHKVRGPLSVWQIQMQAAQLIGEGGGGEGGRGSEVGVLQQSCNRAATELYDRLASPHTQNRGPTLTLSRILKISCGLILEFLKCLGITGTTQVDGSRVRQLDADVQMVGRSCWCVTAVLSNRDGSMSALLSRGHDDCGRWHLVLEQRNREEYTDTCFGVEVCGGHPIVENV